MPGPTTRLLVSVRSLDEARIAQQAGADLLDLKEPDRGALGPVAPEVRQAIREAFAGQVPLSLAAGEWLDQHGPEAMPIDVAGMAYVKWGLAGCENEAGWRESLRQRRDELAEANCQLVAVAYADHRRARAPDPEQIAQLAVAERLGVVLFDTWRKDGTKLLDWLPFPTLKQLVQSLHTAGIAVALAGSLDETRVEQLRGLRPDWFAVRGCVCSGGKRQASIDGDRVRHLKSLLDPARPFTAPIGTPAPRPKPLPFPRQRSDRKFGPRRP